MADVKVAEEQEVDTNTVIVDNGTGRIKAGFSKMDCPKVIFPCMAASPIEPKEGGDVAFLC